MTLAVIFDCDGVVVDSEPASFDLIAKDLRRHGLELTHARMEALFLGGTITGVWTKARALGASLPDNWVADFYDRLYARLAEGTPLIPGIEAVLNRLVAAKIPFAMGSNGSDAKMQITLGQHPAVLAQFKDRMFSGQTLGKPKPAPDLYLHAAAALGVDPARCVVIEDSPTGALAAQSAGMRCLGYAPLGDAAALTAAGAEIFRAMADLPGLLGLNS